MNMGIAKIYPNKLSTMSSVVTSPSDTSKNLQEKFKTSLLLHNTQTFRLNFNLLYTIIFINTIIVDLKLSDSNDFTFI